MDDVRDRVHQLASQFADDWLGSDEWALLRALPPMSLRVYLHGITTLKGSDGFLPARLRQLADDLLPLSQIPRYSLDARVAWLVYCLATEASSTEIAVILDGFVAEFLAPTQQVLHSFTLGEFQVTGLPAGEPVQLMGDWKLHPRGMPLDSRALSLLGAPQGDEPPTSLTRFADVPKGSDLERYRFLSWLYAQLILEGLRLFVHSGAFVAQEDYSPDRPYIGISEWHPATRPTTRVFCALSAARIPELRAFLILWLDLTPNAKPELPAEKVRNRLYQALWHLKRAYDDSNWERALLDAVSGLELLLVGETPELSYRLSIRAGHLLSAHDPGLAGRVFSDIKQMYDVRSKVAHGDWAAAGRLASKHWGGEGRSKEAAGPACASAAIDYLRKAILAAAYFMSKGKDIQTLLDEKSLLNVKDREALHKSLEEDASNPLVRAFMV